MINLRRILYRVSKGTMAAGVANTLLKGLEHERDRIVRHVDPDVVEGGGGFFRILPRTPNDGELGDDPEREASPAPEPDELNRPVTGPELEMIQRGLEEDVVRGRDLPPDWRGCVRRYLVEERTEIAYEDETMRRVVGRFRYRVVEGERPQDVKVQRLFLPIGCLG